MEKRDTKKELLEALESLPEYQAALVLAYIHSLKTILAEHEKKLKEEAFMTYLDSLPEEDKELSDECLKHIAESRKAITEGRVSSFREVAEELGL